MAQGLPLEHHIYSPPDPRKVADVWDYSSPDAACERWHWLSQATLTKLAVIGRKMRSAQAGVRPRSSSARSTTPDQEAAAVAVVRRTGSMLAAVEETGLTRCILDRILREHGIPAPRVDRRAVALKAAATKRARAA